VENVNDGNLSNMTTPMLYSSNWEWFIWWSRSVWETY